MGLKDGLSQVSVFSIHQDHLKRMWFGTRNGLNCWDGMLMTQFYPHRDDSISDIGSNIKQIVQQGNYLWIRLDKGELLRFDMATYKFKKYPIENVRDIINYQNGLLVTKVNNIWVYLPEKDEFIKKKEIFEGEKWFSKLHLDKNNILWVSDTRNNQIVKYNNGKVEFIKMPFAEVVGVNDLLVDSKNKLWIATRYHGLLCYNENDKSFDNINETSSPINLKSNFVRKVIEDNEGRIWAGTLKGLLVIDTKQKKGSLIESLDKINNGLSHNSVHSLFFSTSDDMMWIGTYYGGVHYGQISKQIFTKYNKSVFNEKPTFPVIGPMVEDGKQNIWIGTEGGGLDFFDRENKTFTNFPHLENNGEPSQSNIKSLYLSNNEQLLIGTYRNGLSMLNINTKKFKHYNNNIKEVSCIVPYDDDFLLATTRGIVQFNIKDEVFSPFYFSDANNRKINQLRINKLYQDKKGILWIGTPSEGIWAYNKNTGKLLHFRHDKNNKTSISSNSIVCILEDHNARLWIGTDGGGLNLFDAKKNKFTSYKKESHGLSSNFVYGITESKYGNIWVATSKGLSRFDIEKELFYNYESETNFPLDELNYNALLKTGEGEIFVGGINGLVSFKESDLLLSKKKYDIIFTNLEVNNHEVCPNDATGILKTDISTIKSLTLKPNHTVFKISYSDCNYSSVLKNKYQYKLEGFDKEWVDAQYNTSVNYTNLNPGTYTFTVRGTDMVYTPITAEKSIEIIIEPPLFRTWFAYTLYALLFLSIILLFNYFYLGKVRLTYQLKNELEEKDRIKELNLYKLRFFTNISHEFMTPLTIILSSIEYLFSKQKITAGVRAPLEQVYKNAKRLKNLNHELLDFRKIEQGYLKLKIQENDIVPYINDIYNAFSGIAKERKIDYTFDKNIDHVSIWYDSAQMDKVFYNLLSNAFNYVSTTNSTIKISLKNDFDKLLIQVTNNGKGIPKDEIDKVFNRFFQYDPKKVQKEYYGSGIGLALSQSIIKAHKGEIWCESELEKETTFCVVLMKGHRHFDPKLLSNEKNENHFSLDKDLILSLSSDFKAGIQETNELDTKEAPVLLIVDDNSEMRMILKNLFVDKFNIALASNGEEGMAMALKLQPDIIISDVKMPVLSGFDMCKKLKRNVNTSHIPIALVTALSSDKDQVKGFNCGADSYISKPFNSEKLVARIDNLFNNRKILETKFGHELNVPTKSITKNKIDQVFIEKAQQMIEKNIMNSDFSITDFAQEMGMGRTLFFQKIKAITGQTPNDFVQTIRLKKAADIILNKPDRNLSEIAYDVGFSSPRYFSKCFKNHFGVIPSKYGKAGDE